MGCENYGLVMQPRFSHTILPYTIALLCSIGFIAILRNRGIINTLDSHILFCLLACIYLLALVYTLWYKSKSYHIYPLHISCLLTLLDYCAISTIDTKAIKSSISIIFLMVASYYMHTIFIDLAAKQKCK